MMELLFWGVGGNKEYNDVINGVGCVKLSLGPRGDLVIECDG